MRLISKINRTDIHISFGILVAAILSALSASPVQAQVPNPLEVPRPNQVETPTPSQSQEIAKELFGNDGVMFAVDTVVEFGFVRSYGAYKSTFGVRNEETGEETDLIIEAKPSDNPQDVNSPSDFKTENPNDFLGTPGNTVQKDTAEFKFEAGKRYSFYLRSEYQGRVVGTLYSTDANNSNGKRQVKFDGDIFALANGGSLIRWDDTGSALVRSDQQDTDFDDFIIRIGGHEKCGC
ncbi:hypothetical protein [Mastigocoleus testarum]|uniref:DUF4114 domain-containing protein n=1 Tax=Mastigocoleus testarum BC008 TaxID=371196 RepID=A0A0V7ZHD3_9CYAN|nr:hypothetical protein [Mastigocoleus testarum]KST64005.1 hypothetical protein BC008_40115 [Mastigocoleus testarum BC008]KST64715.1 hypothetical protein BC008_41090 [Mastigocoleus testarum BC008]